tara:strand:+ start:852 stop:1076 length:225 start_codon:yes stop_codon:yes gene_type:complete
LYSKEAENQEGELKKPFKNKNRHIRSKGPTPNTKRTIFAVLGVVFFSPEASELFVFIFFFDFLLGIHKIFIRIL